MIHRNRKRLAALLAVLLCASLTLGGCAEQEPADTGSTAATKSGSTILPAATNSGTTAPEYTPVYATAFENTVVLATLPLEQYGGMEPECDPREISQGGRILCGGEHENEIPITRVVILEDLVPRATCGWFRDMVKLESIQGLEKLHTDLVTDMSYMFTNCESLAVLNIGGWEVSNVTAMTGMFDGCTALAERPVWYE